MTNDADKMVKLHSNLIAGSYNNYGPIKCPQCKKAAYIWIERFKGRATTILRIAHGNNQSARCEV